MDAKEHAFATRAVHAGLDVDPAGAHATPIHATSTFVDGDAALSLGDVVADVRRALGAAAAVAA